MYAKVLKGESCFKVQRKVPVGGGFIEVNLCKEKGAKKVLLYMSVEENSGHFCPVVKKCLKLWF
jgi:hypothetical protein